MSLVSSHKYGHGHLLELGGNRREERTPQGHSRPSQVCISRRVMLRELKERLQRAFTAPRVRDPANRDPSERMFTWVVRGRDGPVGDDRSIRQEQRHDEGVEGGGSLALRLENNDIGGPCRIAHTDLSVESSWPFRIWRVDDHNDPAGVFTRGGIRDFDCL